MPRYAPLLTVVSIVGAVSMALTGCESEGIDATTAVPAPAREVAHGRSLTPDPEDDLLPGEPEEGVTTPSTTPGTPPPGPNAVASDDPSVTAPGSDGLESPRESPEATGPAASTPAPAPSIPAPMPQPTVPVPAPDPTSPVPQPDPTSPVPQPDPTAPPAAAAPTSSSLADFLARSGLTNAHAAGQVPVVASVAEAHALSNASEHVVVSDGTSHVVFDKGADSGVTQTIAGTSYGARFQDAVEMIAWDIPSDAKDTLTSAAAFAASQGKPLALAPSQTYRYTGTVKLPGNLLGLDGRGATLTPTSKGGSSGPVSALQLETESSGVKLHDFTLDMGGTAHTIGLQGNSVKDVAIERIHVKNANHRGIQFTASVSDIDNLLIRDSRIDNVVGEASTKGIVNSIVIEAAQEKESSSDRRSPFWDRYTRTGTISPQRLNARNVTIQNNQITGGYYGVSFSGVSQSTISGNTITMNMRNISMQNNSSGNTVSDNRLLEAGSSGVTIGYNSNDNLLSGNTVISGRATRQALLQAYQASTNNRFLDNTVTVTGEAAPQWMLYTGTDSHGTEFSGNRLSGRARKAVIGVESVWDATSILNRGTNPYSYMSSGYIESPVDGQRMKYNGGFGPLRGVRITGNTFDVSNGQAPLVYVGAEVSRGRDGDRRIIGDVEDLTVSGNTVAGKYSEKMVLHEGEIAGVGQARVHFRDGSFGSS